MMASTTAPIGTILERRTQSIDLFLVGMAGPQSFPDAGSDFEELGRLANIKRPLTRERGLDDIGYPPRTRTHHHDLGRKINRLGNGVGDKADRLVGPVPQVEQLFVEMITHDLVQRPERLI